MNLSLNILKLAYSVSSVQKINVEVGNDISCTFCSHLLEKKKFHIGKIGASSYAGQVGSQEFLDELAETLTPSSVTLFYGVW